MAAPMRLVIWKPRPRMGMDSRREAVKPKAAGSWVEVLASPVMRE